MQCSLCGWQCEPVRPEAVFLEAMPLHSVSSREIQERTWDETILIAQYNLLESNATLAEIAEVQVLLMILHEEADPARCPGSLLPGVPVRSKE